MEEPNTNLDTGSIRHEYLWFALLLLVVLVTSAGHSNRVSPDRLNAPMAGSQN